jgi:hypothetical protein
MRLLRQFGLCPRVPRSVPPLAMTERTTQCMSVAAPSPSEIEDSTTQKVNIKKEL